MPSFPVQPAPISVTPLAFRRDMFRSQFDGGAIATRAKYLKRRVHAVQLSYMITNDDFVTLADFWDEVAGPVLSFDFTYPYTHTVTDATSATPIVITTINGHGYSTGEQVFVAGVNANANGIRTATRLSRTTFSLDGTTAGGAASSGTVARYFPTMRFQEETFGLFPVRAGFGPPADNTALIPVVLMLEESW